MNKYIFNFFIVISIFVTKNLNAVQNIEKFIGKCLKNGGVVFDIGANVGEKTDSYLKLGAKVVSVEPQPNCIKALLKKYGKNKNVVIVDKAIGDTSGKMYMNICSSAPTISSLSNDWISKSRFSEKYKWDQKIEVDVITLDELIEKFGIPSFCKIDV
ncbi:MAG: FkbM family methyltransferase, partial [Candidatus Babeliales bacterium]